jgi:hypothetical protein
MTDLRNNFVRARNYEFSDAEMKSFRIKGVYNSMADADYMNTEYMDRFIEGCYNAEVGEMAISESAIFTTEKGLVRVLSVIVFYDGPSMELYILANQKIYLPADRTMNGRLN